MPWVVVKDTSVYRVDFYIERQEAEVGDRLRYTIRVENKTNRSIRMKFDLQRRTSARTQTCYRCCDERYTTLNGACTRVSGCCSMIIHFPYIDVPPGETREYNLNWSYWTITEGESLPNQSVQWCWYIWIYYYDGNEWRYYGGRRAACVTVRPRTPNVEVLTCYASPDRVEYGDSITLSGSAMTSDRLPLANVQLTVRINGRNYTTVRTDSNGRYNVRISVSRDYFNDGRNTIQVVAPNNRTCTSYVTVTAPSPPPQPTPPPPEQPPTPPPEEYPPPPPPEEEYPPAPPEQPPVTPPPTPVTGLSVKATFTLNFSIRPVPVSVKKNGDEIDSFELSRSQKTYSNTYTLAPDEELMIITPRRTARITYDMLKEKGSLTFKLRHIGLIRIYSVTVNLEAT